MNYIQQNGESLSDDKKFISQSETDNDISTLTYVPNENTIMFTCWVFENNLSAQIVFNYDLSNNSVKDSYGYLLGDSSGIDFNAVGNFTTDYWDGEEIEAIYCSYNGVNMTSSSRIRQSGSRTLTSGFKAGMITWNNMITSISGGKYNIGNLGFINYTTPIETVTPPAPQPSEVPQESVITMYRAYNPNSGEHFYTSNTKEFNNIVSLGWKDEGVGWIAPASSNTPVYRLYNANGGEHHYTTSTKERDALTAAGWKDEGIGWYGVSAN